MPATHLLGHYGLFVNVTNQRPVDATTLSLIQDVGTCKAYIDTATHASHHSFVALLEFSNLLQPHGGSACLALCHICNSVSVDWQPHFHNFGKCELLIYAICWSSSFYTMGTPWPLVPIELHQQFFKTFHNLGHPVIQSTQKLIASFYMGVLWTPISGAR